MADRILLGANHHTFADCLRLALDRGLGLEVQTFAQPEILQGNWRDLLPAYRRAGLAHLEGPLAIHMAPGSPDPLFRQATLQRTSDGLEAAAALGAGTVVFHANFLASIRHPAYREGWTQRNIDFWGPVAGRAASYGLVIALENMWEPDPAIIVDILAAIGSPHLRACLDVGHIGLFSAVPLAAWLETTAPYLVHMHLNNNPGDIDEHQALPHGVLDYDAILAQIRRLPVPPTLTLEMNTVQDMVDSFAYLRLPRRRGIINAVFRRALAGIPS